MYNGNDRFIKNSLLPWRKKILKITVNSVTHKRKQYFWRTLASGMSDPVAGCILSRLFLFCDASLPLCVDCDLVSREVLHVSYLFLQSADRTGNPQTFLAIPYGNEKHTNFTNEYISHKFNPVGYQLITVSKSFSRYSSVLESLYLDWDIQSWHYVLMCLLYSPAILCGRS